MAQQITEAFPCDSAPRYVIRDRDSVYGAPARARIKALGIEELVTAHRPPWQNPFVERMIGSIRPECLDHLIVIDERHLRRIAASYFDYYHRSSTHLSLGKDSPISRYRPSSPRAREGTRSSRSAPKLSFWEGQGTHFSQTL